MQSTAVTEQKATKKQRLSSETTEANAERKTTNKQRLPWEMAEALADVPALAAWPADIRALLAVYASSASVVVVYHRGEPTETVTLVLTPDTFETAERRAAIDGEYDRAETARRVSAAAKYGEQWRARHEAELQWHVLPEPSVLGRRAGPWRGRDHGLAFYADAAGDHLLASDPYFLYDLHTQQTTSLPAYDGCVDRSNCYLDPSPYNSAVAFRTREAILVSTHRNTTPALVPTTALTVPNDVRQHDWFWTRYGRSGQPRPELERPRVADGTYDGGDGAADPMKAAGAHNCAAHLYALCIAADGGLDHAFLMAWNSATGEWLRLPGRSKLRYTRQMRSKVVVLEGGRHVVVIGGIPLRNRCHLSAEVYDAVTGTWRAAPQWAPPTHPGNMSYSVVTECDGWLMYLEWGNVFATRASLPSDTPSASVVGSDAVVTACNVTTITTTTTATAATAATAATDHSSDGENDCICSCNDSNPSDPRTYTLPTAWVYIARIGSLAKHVCSAATVPALADRAALRALLRAK